MSSLSFKYHYHMHSALGTYLFSNILAVVLLEGIYHLVVVLANVLNVVAHAVDSLLDVVVGLDDAVLEVEAAGVAMGHQHLLKTPEDLRTLCLLAQSYLLIVRLRITQILVLVARLSCRRQVLSLHFLEGVRESNKEIVEPLLGYVCGGQTFDLAIVDGLKLMELLVVVLLKHLLEYLPGQTVIGWVHICSKLYIIY